MPRATETIRLRVIAGEHVAEAEILCRQLVELRADHLQKLIFKMLRTIDKMRAQKRAKEAP